MNPVTDGDGCSPETDMFAKYPGPPSESVSNIPGGPRRRIRCKMCRQELATREHMLDHGQFGPATPVDISGLRLFDGIISTATDGRDQQSKDGHVAEGAPPPVESPPTTHFINPSDLSSQSSFANPALRSTNSPSSISSPPILLNAKCSGYFVEPMKWMEHFLSGGQLAGKIICPNKKCTAKLGNYDWAGVCCGCKQWVTPGFCINRSKVDEVV